MNIGYSKDRWDNDDESVIYTTGNLKVYLWSVCRQVVLQD